MQDYSCHYYGFFIQKQKYRKGRQMSKINRFLLVLMAILLHAPVVIASFPAEKFMEVQNKVSVERKCLPGQEIQLILPFLYAAKIDCHQLGIGLNELYLWTDSTEIEKAKMTGLWEDGSIFQFEVSMNKRQKVCVPIPPRIAIYTTLELQDKNIHASIRVETDVNTITNVLKEKRTKALSPIDYNERLISFIRLWAEVKYNFAFFDRVPKVNWDNVLEEYLPRITQEQNTQEYYKLLQTCFARLNDGHTDIISPPTTNMMIPPILIRPIDGKAIVFKVEDVNEVVQAGITEGMEITQVDGRTVNSILETDIYPYICAGSKQFKELKAYSQLLAGDFASKINICFADMQGVTHEATLTRSYPIYGVPFNKPVLTYKKLENGIVYVALNSFEDEAIVREFDNVFHEILNSNGLIIDIRENGGGNSSNGNAIIGRLTNKPLLGSRWKSPQHTAVFKAWKMQEKFYEGNANSIPVQGDRPFLGPIVILTGAGTISAAEDFLIPLHAAGRAILVGEKTAGTTGQPLIIELPKGGKARICTKHDTYPDGKEFVGIGIIPDVEVHPTQKDIYNGQDIIMDKGLEVLKKQIFVIF
jgi:C-terminal processing protease CtpA/Prc